MLVYHLYALNIRYYPDFVFPDFFSAGTVGVDIFFVISGFVMALVTSNSKPGYHTVRSFVLKRVTRVYPIYWIYTLIVLLIYFVRPDVVNSSYLQTPSIVKSLLLFPDITNPWLSVGWTLIYEVYFYFLVAILLFFNMRIRNILLCLYFLFLVLYNVLFYIDTNPVFPVEKYYLSPLICEFILGYGLFFFYGFRPLSFVIGFVLSSLCFLFVISTSYWVDVDSNLIRLLVFGLPSVLFVYGFQSCFIGKRKFGVMARLGDISYSTYLSHVLVLNAVGLFFKLIGLDGIFGSLLCLIISVFAVYVWSYFSYFYIEKKVSKFG